MDESGVGAEGVHNQITGTVLGPSVQAGVIHGGVHVHPVPIPTVVPRQLPGAIPNFVGRIHELDILTAQVDRATESGGTVVITSIGGTAGIGKTTLAIYWGRQVLDRFPMASFI